MADGFKRAGFGAKPALVVVDITRLLADPNVPGHLECAEQASEQITRLLAVARQRAVPIDILYPRWKAFLFKQGSGA